MNLPPRNIAKWIAIYVVSEAFMLTVFINLRWI